MKTKIEAFRARLERLRRSGGAGSGGRSQHNAEIDPPGTKAFAGLTDLGDRPGSRHDTIVALAPPLRPMKSLCIEEGNFESPVPDSAVKLFKIRFADSAGRRRSASFLVQRRYSWRGYHVRTPSAQHHNRVTLSAYDGNDVVATISVGYDSQSGLFVGALFASELQTLRDRRGRICEFTKLAIDETIKSKPVLAALFHIAYIHARRIGSCTDLVVEVNPRHVRFYERMLGFHALGAARMDPRVQAPATLLHLDLSHAEAQIAKFGGKVELAAQVRSLYPYFFSPHEEAGIEQRLRAYS